MRTKMFNVTKLLGALLLATMMTVALIPSVAFGTTSEEAEGPPQSQAEWQWHRYCNNVDNNAVVDRHTITSTNEADTKWTWNDGSDKGWSAAPTPPLISDKYVYIGVGSRVVQLDKETGQETELSKQPREPFYKGQNVGFGTKQMLYAEGKIFVAIQNGSIQCVDADTLKPLWATSSMKGQQTISNLEYKKIDGVGYVFIGTWLSETNDGSLIAVKIDDEGIKEEEHNVKCYEAGGVLSKEAKDVTQKVKTPAWTFVPSKDGDEFATTPRGFYWSGAYVTDDYMVIGTDDGAPANSVADTASLITLNPKTGEFIDSVDDIRGDIRTAIAHERRDGKDYVYCSTKGGILYRFTVDESGMLSDQESIDLGGMTTATPLIHKGRIYIGVCGSRQFDANSNHTFAVVKDEDSGLSLAYKQPVPGYPQECPLLTTAYENEDYDNDGQADGRVYVYFTYNARPGGIYYFYDTPNATKATMSREDCLLYTPEKSKQQFCLSPVVSDKEGTLYFKNDSNNIFAVSKNPAYLTGLDVKMDGEPLKLADGTTLKESFGPKVTSYSAKVDATQISLEITPKAVEGGKVTVNGQEFTGSPIKVDVVLNGGIGDVVVKVEKTDAGQLYTREYTIQLMAEGTVADAKDIVVTPMKNLLTKEMFKDGQLVPTLSPDVSDYTTMINDEIKKTGQCNLWISMIGDNAKFKVEPVENVKTDAKSYDKDTGTLKSYAASSEVQGKFFRVPIYAVNPKKNIKVKVVGIAEDGVKTKTYNITIVNQYIVTGVTLDKTYLNLAPGEKAQLKAEVEPENAENKNVKWTVEGKAASVDEKGLVTAKETGTATVTATTEEGNFTATASVVVVEPALKKAKDKAFKILKDDDLSAYKDSVRKDVKAVLTNLNEDIEKAENFDATTAAVDKAEASLKALGLKGKVAEDVKAVFQEANPKAPVEPENPDKPEKPVKPIPKVANGWVEGNGNWYYYKNSVMVTGWVQSGNNWYFMNPDGAMATGWVNVGGARYYMNGSGAMTTGWQQVGSKWYYLNSSGAMVTGWVKSGNTWYFMNGDGTMATGWVDNGGSRYYMNGSGAMTTGWQQVGGKWYYMDASGTMATGWVQSGNTWYFMNGDGTMATGWVKDGGSQYYMNSSGAMVKGWLQEGDKWYYFNPSGAMTTGWVKVGSTWYFMDKDGVMATGNIEVGGVTYKIAPSGAWIG